MTDLVYPLAPQPSPVPVDDNINSAGIASTAATTATTKAAEALASANIASASAATATTKASEAATSATSAAASAATATTKASDASAASATAQTKASEASASATNAASSATTATTKASEAAASATAASGSASTSSTKASEAAASATAASSSASTATTKATEAAASASTATTKASEAATSATNAAAAAASAIESANQAGIAAGHAAGANTSEANALASANLSTQKANDATAQAVIATTKAAEADASAYEAGVTVANAVSIAQASGNVVFFTTHADAIAGLAGLPDGQVVEIWMDETKGGKVTRYRKEYGALAFKIYLTIAPQPAMSDADLLAAMPSGIQGLWVMDTWGAYPNNIVKNLAAVSTPELNLLRNPRRFFTTGAVGTAWITTGFTTVKEDGTVAGWDGSNSATQLTASVANSGSVSWQSTLTLPAGTYTLAVWVRSRTGSPQTFNMRHGATTVNKTADITWSRQTVTFTLASPTATALYPVINDGLGGTLDIEIMDAKLYAAGAAPADVTPAGHMYFGASGFDTVSCVNGELDFTGGKQGDCEWKDPFTSGSSTIIVIAKKVVDDSGLTSHDSPFFYGVTGASPTGLIWALNDVNGGGNLAFANPGGQSAQPNNRFNPKTFDKFTGYRMIGGAGDSVHNSVWFDDAILYTTQSLTTSTTTCSKFHVGKTNTGLPMHYKIFALAFWPTKKLSGAEMHAAYNALRMRYNLNGFNFGTKAARVLVAEGDSITLGPSSQSYFYHYVPNAPANVPTIFVQNALSGSTIRDNANATLNLIYRQAELDASLPNAADRAGRKFILTVLIGANDLQAYYGGSATNFLNYLWAYTDARRAAGWTVGVATILPKGSTRTGYAQHNTLRATVNPLIRTAVGTHCDFVIDFAADATMGPDSAPNDATLQGDGNKLYLDGLHPSSLSHQLYLEPIYRAAVDAI